MRSLLREEVPVDYQDKLIRSAYRPAGLTAIESIQSLFQWHNETFNFWTHFLVFGYFIYKFYTLNLPLLEDPYYWPLLCVSVGTCAYPLLSSLAHAFCSMDLGTRHLVFQLDYMGISFYTCASSMAFLAYTSPAHHLHSGIAYVYAYICAVIAVICCLASCMSRHIPNTGHLLRLSAFSLSYFFTLSFLLTWLLYYQSSPLAHHYGHILWNPIIGLVNGSRLPERYVPFCFDVIGHSHQIFHIVVFIATNYQVNAIIQDCLLKKGAINVDIASMLCVQVVIIVWVADALIVAYHAIKINRQENLAKKNN